MPTTKKKTHDKRSLYLSTSYFSSVANYSHRSTYHVAVLSSCPTMQTPRWVWRRFHRHSLIAPSARQQCPCGRVHDGALMVEGVSHFRCISVSTRAQHAWGPGGAVHMIGHAQPNTHAQRHQSQPPTAGWTGWDIALAQGHLPRSLHPKLPPKPPQKRWQSAGEGRVSKWSHPYWLGLAECVNPTLTERLFQKGLIVFPT